MKENIKKGKDAIGAGMKLLSPSNIKQEIAKLKTKNNIEIALVFLKMFFYLFYGFGYAIISVVIVIGDFILKLLRGEFLSPNKGPAEKSNVKNALRKSSVHYIPYCRKIRINL